MGLCDRHACVCGSSHVGRGMARWERSRPWHIHAGGGYGRRGAEHAKGQLEQLHLFLAGGQGPLALQSHGRDRHGVSVRAAASQSPPRSAQQAAMDGASQDHQRFAAMSSTQKAFLAAFRSAMLTMPRTAIVLPIRYSGVLLSRYPRPPYSPIQTAIKNTTKAVVNSRWGAVLCTACAGDWGSVGGYNQSTSQSAPYPPRLCRSDRGPGRAGTLLPRPQGSSIGSVTPPRLVSVE